MPRAKAGAGPLTPTPLQILRYHLYWVNLDPTQGSEIAKTRPVLVVSPDAMNKRLKPWSFARSPVKSIRHGRAGFSANVLVSLAKLRLTKSVP